MENQPYRPSGPGAIYICDCYLLKAVNTFARISILNTQSCKYVCTCHYNKIFTYLLTSTLDKLDVSAFYARCFQLVCGRLKTKLNEHSTWKVSFSFHSQRRVSTLLITASVRIQRLACVEWLIRISHHTENPTWNPMTNRSRRFIHFE